MKFFNDGIYNLEKRRTYDCKNTVNLHYEEFILSDSKPF